MKYNLPNEIHLYIYSLYYKYNVLPECISHVQNKSYFKKTVLPECMVFVIGDQASRLINDVLDPGVIPDLSALLVLDEMYYDLVHLHKLGIYDLFI